ncbi:hypothetical protein [Nocardia neocaledoniensis]|uniref:hypothetical protein n=1 Tax=Nocardia neocaledoniensis TaxID=236511 RepID=UPI003D791D9C
MGDYLLSNAYSAESITATLAQTTGTKGVEAATIYARLLAVAPSASKQRLRRCPGTTANCTSTCAPDCD